MNIWTDLNSGFGIIHAQGATWKERAQRSPVSTKRNQSPTAECAKAKRNGPDALVKPMGLETPQVIQGIHWLTKQLKRVLKKLSLH